MRTVGTWAEDTAHTPQPTVTATNQKADWTPYTMAEGLLNNDVRFLDLAGKGQLVAGLHLRSRKLGTYVQCFDSRWTQPDSMFRASGPVTAATTQANGTLWAAEHGRIRRIKNGQATVSMRTMVRTRVASTNTTATCHTT